MSTGRYFRVSIKALSALIEVTTRRSGFPPKATLFAFLALCAEIERRKGERLVEAPWRDFSAVTITCTAGALVRHVEQPGAKTTGARRERYKRALKALAKRDVFFEYEERPAYGQSGPRSVISHRAPILEQRDDTVTLHAWPTDGSRYFVLVDFALLRLAPLVGETAARLLCLLVILRRALDARGVWELRLDEQCLTRAGIVRTPKRSDDLARVRSAVRQLASLGVLTLLSDEPVAVRLSPPFFFHRSKVA